MQAGWRACGVDGPQLHADEQLPLAGLWDGLLCDCHRLGIGRGWSSVAGAGWEKKQAAMCSLGKLPRRATQALGIRQRRGAPAPLPSSTLAARLLGVLLVVLSDVDHRLLAFGRHGCQ